jgi:uncharacterized protein
MCLKNSIGKYAAHSCNPNMKVEAQNSPKGLTVQYVAIKDIDPNTTLSFDYCTTERRFAAPFECCCGAENCRIRIDGWETLPPAQKDLLSVNALPYLKEEDDNIIIDKTTK